MASNPNPLPFAPSRFSIPNQAGTSPNANDTGAGGPIPGLGGGIAAPPVGGGILTTAAPAIIDQPYSNPNALGQALPPNPPVSQWTLPPQNAQVQPRGGTFLNVLGDMFAPRVMRDIPGTMAYQRAMQAHGLAAPEPGTQRTESTPQSTSGRSGRRGLLSRAMGAAREFTGAE